MGNSRTSNFDAHYLIIFMYDLVFLSKPQILLCIIFKQKFIINAGPCGIPTFWSYGNPQMDQWTPLYTNSGSNN